MFYAVRVNYFEIEINGVRTVEGAAGWAGCEMDSCEFCNRREMIFLKNVLRLIDHGDGLFDLIKGVRWVSNIRIDLMLRLVERVRAINTVHRIPIRYPVQIEMRITEALPAINRGAAGVAMG
jgi:hypothetical protein